MTTMDRRKLLTGVGLATLSIPLLVGCRPREQSGGNNRSSLQINSFGGTFQKAVEDTVVAPFQKDSGTSVDVTTAISSDALARLKSSPKDSPAYDVAYMDLAVIYQAIAADLVQKIDTDKLSSLSDIYPLAVDEEGYWVAELVSMTGIAYNTEKVDTPPNSWNDLWDSNLKDKIAISDIGGTAGYQFLVQSAKLNGGNENAIDPGFSAVKKLSDNIVSYYKTPDEMSKLLSSGEAYMGPWYADRASALKKSGAPVDFVVPKEGAIAVLSAMCVPAGTNMLDEAHAYIDYQLAAKTNSEFVKAIAEGPTNKEVKLDDSYLNDNFIPYGEDAISALIEQDSKAIAQNLSGWVDRWNSEIVN
ncbi:ABC transporter substrate-binding protein [Brevibacterium oceani]|uniref:ABC transporter substrate-binding protein n=1 Tax=Brevibacterium oceani TaxID=358099 RepID=UPI0015E6E2DD|nr:ABC transporter substrate-binding protein [Brevibacterium oceani]